MSKPSSDAFVGFRVTCRACGDNKRIGMVGLNTIEGDGGEPWFEGAGITPAGHNTSMTFRCKSGHTTPVRIDKLMAVLSSWKAEVGVNGRRVETLPL